MYIHGDSETTQQQHSNQPQGSPLRWSPTGSPQWRSTGCDVTSRESESARQGLLASAHHLNDGTSDRLVTRITVGSIDLLHASACRCSLDRCRFSCYPTLPIGLCCWSACWTLFFPPRNRTFGVRSHAARLETRTGASPFEQPPEARQGALGLRRGDVCQSGFGYTWHSSSCVQQSKESSRGPLR